MSILVQQLLHSADRCAIFSRAMQARIFEQQTDTATAIKVDGVEIRLIRLPLIEPFETSFGKVDSRLIFLVCLEANGLTGWGEVVAAEEPLYSYETTGTALHVIRDFLAPAVVDAPITDLERSRKTTVAISRTQHGQGGTRARIHGSAGSGEWTITFGADRR